jgi:Fic family protein
LKMEKATKDINGLILAYVKENTACRSMQIYDSFKGQLSFTTVKRILKKFVSENLVTVSGNGKSTKYTLGPGYEMLRNIDVEQYFEQETDERVIKNGFNHSIIKDTLSHAMLFTNAELQYLTNLQNKFEENAARLSATEYKNELERLAIDLSWKSSQIEGNTYSLLETERLLKQQETTSGKTKDEAAMLLNHKITIDFIIANPDYIQPLSVARVEDIHNLLIKDLDINRNIRNARVGITGTNYKPLDNDYQLKEALDDMCNAIHTQPNVFSKALLVLILISYIQPFADGNKRTARIIANALLINYKYCPISFRTVSAIDYKKAMLMFYEQNNIYAFKKIFINQFEFAVNTYF